MEVSEIFKVISTDKVKVISLIATCVRDSSRSKCEKFLVKIVLFTRNVFWCDLLSRCFARVCCCVRCSQYHQRIFAAPSRWRELALADRLTDNPADGSHANTCRDLRLKERLFVSRAEFSRRCFGVLYRFLC